MEFDREMEDFISDIDEKVLLDNDDAQAASYEDDGIDEFVADIDKTDLDDNDGIASFPHRREDDEWEEEDWDVL